ncbi:MAG: esterase [Pseudopedobacter saltans]|uniref:Esterase n=1 Tax=Pseudopedobacter saltans TaxID=151895 RepID=A0A2W5F0X3_9SPHI|nr:MAG: esterase [Pseudopedobacter saltans]
MRISNFAFLLLFLSMLSCRNQPEVVDIIPDHQTFTIKSEKLGETRTINIWAPKDSTIVIDSLPVMYVLDGGIKEDFPHVANTFSELIKAKKIPPFLLVGIENTQRRRDMTGPTTVEKDKEIAPVVGGAAKFRDFISDELFAEIAKRYPKTTHKGIIGESAAGLFVMETLFTKTNMFDYYIAFDPSLWWNGQLLTQSAKIYLEKMPPEKKVLWFASSSATDVSPFAQQLAQTLAAQDITSLSWNYSDEPEEQHNTIFRATKEKALIWALNQKM